MSSEKQFLKKKSYGATSSTGSPAAVSKKTDAQNQEEGSVNQPDFEGGNHDWSEHDKTLTLQSQLHFIFFDRWQMKLLMLGCPLAIFGKYFHATDAFLFTSAFLALVPLAALLGDCTEDICKRTNDVIGALVNVTFGNATELIISICALRAGMLDLIKFSLIGSILGNMLLVLGTGFLVGGLKYNVMKFNADAANTYSPLLLLAVLSFVIPSGYASLHADERGSGKQGDANILIVSRQVATVSCLVYVGYMFFQLYTHKAMFDEEEDNENISNQNHVAEDDDDEEEGPQFTWTFGLISIAIVSVLISWLSDILVDTIQGAAVSYKVPHQFIAIIIVPIVGNAAEHASAIIMANRGKMDIAVGVAMGSSIQIAAFVMPLLVVVGWFVNVPLDMNFHPFCTALLFVSVLVASAVTNDGKTNWLEGLMLFACYVMIAITFMHGHIDIK